MTKRELWERLSAMDSAGLEQLLQVLVKDQIDRNPHTAAAFESSEILSAGLQQAATDAALVSGAFIEPEDKTEALRAIALELAEDPRYTTLIGNALAAGRSTRLDPVTASVVLAGIVLVLQTRFDVRYDNTNGKKKLHIAISKSETSEKLLGKLFGLFRFRK